MRHSVYRRDYRQGGHLEPASRFPRNRGIVGSLLDAFVLHHRC